MPLGDELGHRLHAGRGVARLVVEVRVLERRAAELGDVLGGEVEAAAHRLAVERAGAGQRQDGAELDRLALAGAGLVDAEQLLQRAAAAAASAGRRAEPPPRSSRSPAAVVAVAPRPSWPRTGGRRTSRVIVVVTAAGGEERGRADRPGRPEQHPTAGDPALVHDLRHVLVIHSSAFPCVPAFTAACGRGVDAQRSTVLSPVADVVTPPRGRRCREWPPGTRRFALLIRRVPLAPAR